jgi:hypothetical protein
LFVWGPFKEVEDKMPQYIGFIRSVEDSHAQLGPEEAQRVLERYLAWSEEHRVVAGGGLSRGGRVLRALGSTDGPHTEATEIVGGFVLLEANDLDQAEKMLSSHPHLEFGPIELRKVGERGCED